MAQRFLVLGDNHGDTESLRRVLADSEGETFDFAVHVGDFTNAVRTDREQAAEQLRDVEPLLEAIDERTRHGLVWVYGNRDRFGDFDYDLGVGTEIPGDDCITVGGQRFTNSPDEVESDVILVTHMENWSLIDHFDGKAHFCGNTHHGRYRNRRLNSAFLQYTHPETREQTYGGYFVVEVAETPPFEIEVRPIGTLEREHCEIHGERGIQFLPESQNCMYCTDDRILMREMAATSFYGLASDTERDAVAADELVEYAVATWDDPPSGFEGDFHAYLADVSDDRYAPLSRADGDRLRVADDSYAY